jgi:hypothetical protein
MKTFILVLSLASDDKTIKILNMRNHCLPRYKMAIAHKK